MTEQMKVREGFQEGRGGKGRVKREINEENKGRLMRQ